MKLRWLPEAALVTGTGTAVVSAGWALNQLHKDRESPKPSALRMTRTHPHVLPDVLFTSSAESVEQIRNAIPAQSARSQRPKPPQEPIATALAVDASLDSTEGSTDDPTTNSNSNDQIAAEVGSAPTSELVAAAPPPPHRCSSGPDDRLAATDREPLHVCGTQESPIAPATASENSDRDWASERDLASDRSKFEVASQTLVEHPVPTGPVQITTALAIGKAGSEIADHQPPRLDAPLAEDVPSVDAEDQRASISPTDRAVAQATRRTSLNQTAIARTWNQSIAVSQSTNLATPDDIAPALGAALSSAAPTSVELPIPQFGLASSHQVDSRSGCMTQCRPVDDNQNPEMRRPNRATAEPGSLSVTLLSDSAPQFAPNDELVLSIKTSSGDVDEIITAYGSRLGVYVPIGEIARILGLALKVSDEGNFVSGWIVSPDRTVSLNLRSREGRLRDRSIDLPPADFVSFEGEAYVKADVLSQILPIVVKIDLRDQSVIITPTELLPFQARLDRERERDRLASQNRSRVREQLPFEPSEWKLASFPLSDIELRAIADDTFGMRTELELRSAADFAFLTAKGFLELTSRDGVTGARLEMGRKDPFARLLGPLRATQFAFGDVANVSQPIGFRSVAGRGVTLSNAHLDESSVFDRVDLRGPLPDGYEVELYRNNILVNSSKNAINGQYEFLQIPLDYGLNVLRLVFFGPQGQTREEVRRFNVGSGRLPQGQFNYNFSAVQKDKPLFEARAPLYVPAENEGQWRVASNVAYGLSSKVTLAASLSTAWGHNKAFPSWLGNFGIRTEVSGIPLLLDAATQEGGGYGLRTAIAAKISTVTIAGSHAEYRGGLLDETQAFEGVALRRASSLDVNGLVSAPFGQLPLAARVSRVEFENRRTVTSAYLRTSMSLGSTLLSPSLEYVSTENAQSASKMLVSGFDLALFRNPKTRIRLSANTEILPRPAFGQVSAQLDQTLTPRDSYRLSAAHSIQFGQTQIGGAYNRRFANFILSLDGSVTLPTRSYYVGLRLSTGVFKNPYRNTMHFTRPGVTGGGLLAFRAFNDENADGQFNSGELPVPGIAVSAGGQEEETNSEGFGYLYGLGDGVRSAYKIDQSTTPDIFSAAAKDGAMFVPRAGSIQTADIPILALSEIAGTALIQTKFGMKGVSGLMLDLVNEKSGKHHSVRTRGGGTFSFEGIEPGRYRLSISTEQAERFGIIASPGQEINILGDSDIYQADLLFVKSD